MNRSMPAAQNTYGHHHFRNSSRQIYRRHTAQRKKAGSRTCRSSRYRGAEHRRLHRFFSNPGIRFAASSAGTGFFQFLRHGPPSEQPARINQQAPGTFRPASRQTGMPSVTNTTRRSDSARVQHPPRRSAFAGLRAQRRFIRLSYIFCRAMRSSASAALPAVSAVRPENSTVNCCGTQEDSWRRRPAEPMRYSVENEPSPIHAVGRASEDNQSTLEQSAL